MNFEFKEIFYTLILIGFACFVVFMVKNIHEALFGSGSNRSRRRPPSRSSLGGGDDYFIANYSSDHSRNHCIDIFSIDTTDGGGASGGE